MHPSHVRHATKLLGLGVLMTPLAAPALAAGHDYIGGDIFTRGLSTWNSSNIETTYQPQSALPGAYVLGIEMTAKDAGWFVIPYNDSAATTQLPGLYHMQAGLSTKTSGMPFKTPAFAGLERSADGTKMYTILDKTWLGTGNTSELYSIAFDGTFTKLSTITLPGIAHPDIDGLTRNPATGELYFLDRSTHFADLYKINPDTFVVTHIGALNVVGTGATNLAFSEDGSELVCLTNLYKLYSVDPLNGKPTLIGSSPAPLGDMEHLAPSPGALPLAGLLCIARRRRR